VFRDGWACNLAEGDSVGHLVGHTSGKCTDLLMDVHEESVRFPASHFADGEGVDAIEMHCHGPTSTKGVAADIRRHIAEVVETHRLCRFLDSGVDVGSGDFTPCLVEGVFEFVDWGGDGSTVGKDVGNAVG